MDVRRKIVMIILLAIPVFILAQEEKSGFCAEFIGQTHFAEGRLVELAEAVPGETYSWSPASGVRSISEIYRHAAFANYAFMKFSGFELPAGIDFEKGPKAWDSAVTAKEEVIASLKKSFVDLREAAQNIKENELERKIKVFGMEMSLRNFMVSSLNHMHEHLGQSIAYARSNNVTPPWSAKPPSTPKNPAVEP